MSHDEEEQQKELLLLDDEWQELPDEHIPIDIGPRHFSATGTVNSVSLLRRLVAAGDMRRGDRYNFVPEDLTMHNPGVHAMESFYSFPLQLLRYFHGWKQLALAIAISLFRNPYFVQLHGCKRLDWRLANGADMA